LNEREHTVGQALFREAVAVSDLTIEVREIAQMKEIVVKTLPCRVAKKERVAHDVIVLYLKLPPSERLQYLAGQYLDILLRDGQRRGFSIANAPHCDEFIELHVRHVPGGEFTGYVFDSLQEKALLRIQGPLGTFFLREDSPRPILLMGGGTGFAPLKGILEHAFAIGIDRAMHLFWGVRARRDLYAHALPQSWAKRYPHFQYTPVLSEPAPDDRWTGRTGLVHEALLQNYPDLSGYDVYMSGPPPMIEAAQKVFRAHGLPEDRLFFDSFEFTRQLPLLVERGA
jgi:2-polyprenylphenol hydroxylase and related flavodoxin oxidoreductases